MLKRKETDQLACLEAVEGEDEVRVLGKMPLDPVSSRGMKEMWISSPGKGSESFKEGEVFLTPFLLHQHSDGDFFWNRMRSLAGKENERWNTQCSLSPTTDRNVAKDKKRIRQMRQDPREQDEGAGTLNVPGDSTW